MILFVRGYQKLIRPLLPPMCRFQPGCSEYFILAVKKHGPIYGLREGSVADLPLQPVVQRRV